MKAFYVLLTEHVRPKWHFDPVIVFTGYKDVLETRIIIRDTEIFIIETFIQSV